MSRLWLIHKVTQSYSRTSEHTMTTTQTTNYVLDCYDLLLAGEPVRIGKNASGQHHTAFREIAKRQGCEIENQGEGLMMHQPRYLGGK